MTQPAPNLMTVQAAAGRYGCDRTYIQWLLSEKHIDDAWTGVGHAPAHEPRVDPEQLDQWWIGRGWHRSSGGPHPPMQPTPGGIDDGADTLLNFAAQIDALLATFDQERRQASAALKAEIEEHRRTTKQRDDARRDLKFDRKQHKRELRETEKRGAAEAQARALLHGRIVQRDGPQGTQDLSPTP